MLGNWHIIFNFHSNKYYFKKRKLKFKEDKLISGDGQWISYTAKILKFKYQAHHYYCSTIVAKTTRNTAVSWDQLSLLSAGFSMLRSQHNTKWVVNWWSFLASKGRENTWFFVCLKYNFGSSKARMHKFWNGIGQSLSGPSKDWESWQKKEKKTITKNYLPENHINRHLEIHRVGSGLRTHTRYQWQGYLQTKAAHFLDSILLL